MTGKEDTSQETKYTKISLEDRKELEEAINWALKNKDIVLAEEGIKEFNLRVAKSVLYSRTVSEKQMPYLEALLEVYKDKAQDI